MFACISKMHKFALFKIFIHHKLVSDIGTSSNLASKYKQYNIQGKHKK